MMIRISKQKALLLTNESLYLPGQVWKIKSKAEFLLSVPYGKSEEYLNYVKENLQPIEYDKEWFKEFKTAFLLADTQHITKLKAYHVPYTIFPINAPYLDYEGMTMHRDLKKWAPKIRKTIPKINLANIPQYTYITHQRQITDPTKKVLLIIGQNPGKAEAVAGVPMVFETGMMIRRILAMFSHYSNIIVVLDNANPIYSEGNSSLIKPFWYYSLIRLMNIKYKLAIVVLGASALNFVLQEGNLKVNSYLNTVLWGGNWNAPVFVALHPSAIIRTLRINHTKLNSTYTQSLHEFRDAHREVLSELFSGKYRRYLEFTLINPIRRAIEWLQKS